MNKHIKDQVVIVVFHASLLHGCDYAVQTIEILSKQNVVIGLALGDAITWKHLFYRNRMPFVQKHKNTIIVRPFFLIPGQRLFVIKQINYQLNALLIWVYATLFLRLRKKYFWFFEPFFMPIFLRIFSSYITIFDCVDYFLSAKQPFLSHFIYSLKHASYVFINSYALKRKIRVFRPDATVVPLGFAHALFQKTQIRRDVHHKPFSVGFIGGIDERLDYQLLYRVALALPSTKFIFVGKNYYSTTNPPPFAKLLFSLSNVHHHEEIAKSLVPTILTTFDVGIIPYDIQQPFNRFCFPMKILEYFFVGLPVISTNIEEIRKYRDLVVVIKTPQEMILEIKRIKEHGWSNKKKLKQQSVALQHSWEHKIQAIQKTIGSVHA